MRAYKKLYRGFESHSLRQKNMKNRNASKILLILFSISSIISLCIFLYLFIKHPLTQYQYLDWLGDPTLSDYGQIPQTKTLTNTTFTIYGILNILNVITLLRILKIKKATRIYLLIASIGIMGVGLVPIPLYGGEPIKNAIHWSLGGLALLAQPILISFIIPRKGIKYFFITLFILAIIASIIWYFFNDYQKLFGELILGGVAILTILTANYFGLRKLVK